MFFYRLLLFFKIYVHYTCTCVHVGIVMDMYVQLVILRQLNQLNACQEEHEKKEQLLAQMEASFKKKADAYFEMESKLILREKAIQHDFQAFTKVHVPRN